MLRRPHTLRRSTSGIDPSMRPLPRDMQPTFSVSATKLRVTFAEPPVYSGILPAWTITGVAHGTGENPIGVAQFSPTIFDVDFTGNVAANDVLTITERDPGFRSDRGGYVLPQVKTLS